MIVICWFLKTSQTSFTTGVKYSTTDSRHYDGFMVHTDIILLDNPVRYFMRHAPIEVLTDRTTEFFKDVRLSVISWNRVLLQQ